MIITDETYEMRWCGLQFPDWDADSTGRVYRDGIEVTPYRIDKHHRYQRVSCHGRVIGAHALVATAFHGPRPDGMECRHLNDVRTDNRPVNLCWGTQLENARDAVRNGVQFSWCGEMHGRAKLTGRDVRTIRQTYAEGRCSQAKLAAAYGVSQRLVSGIVRRETWRHLADDSRPQGANF